MQETSNSPLARREIERFSGRVTLGLLLAGFLEAGAFLAMALFATAVTLRMFDMQLPLHWSLLLLAVPALLYAVLHVRRFRLTRDESAQHLDRRVGLGGLLMSGQEVDISGWRDVVYTRLRDTSPHQPRPRAGRLLARTAVAAAAVGALWLLPDLPHDYSVDNPMVATELKIQEQELKLLLEAGAVREEEATELKEKLAELKRKHQQNQGRGTWTELDAFGDKLDFQRSRRQDALGRARANLKEMSGSSPGRMSNQASFRALAEARGLGLLDKLPKSLADKLDKAFAAGSPSKTANALDLTPEELELLAKALADVPAVPGVGALGAGTGKGVGDEELRRAMEDLKGALKCKGEGGACEGCQGVGKGGLDRGPGHATLEYNNDVKDGTDGMQSRKLPPGMSLPEKDAQSLGLSVAAPRTDPRRAGATGSAGVAGEGEAAWRRRMAPRHRRAVQKFFSDQRANRGKRGR